MGYWDYCRGPYRNPFLHSLLRTREMKRRLKEWAWGLTGARETLLPTQALMNGYSLDKPAM